MVRPFSAQLNERDRYQRSPTMGLNLLRDTRCLERRRERLLRLAISASYGDGPKLVLGILWLFRFSAFFRRLPILRASQCANWTLFRV